MNNNVERDKIITRTSIIGIATNIMLVIFKAFIGFMTNSIAITLDALNNLSDVMSSVVTIIGSKLANRLPDKKHPLGHGRLEYLSAMVVAAIVLYAGITAGIASVKKIIHPEAAEYSLVSLIIIGVAVVVKIVLGLYVRNKGKQVSSGALEASGKDALFDAILSASVLASALIFIFTGLSFEPYVGILISGFIIKAGIEMMLETISDIVGHREDAALTMKIKELIRSEEGVRGAYDLMVNDYGPNRHYASVHIELPDDMTVKEVDIITRHLEALVYAQTGVVLTAVGVYSYNTKDDAAAKLRNEVQELILAYDWAIQFHGFYVDMKEKSMRFDVVMSFDIKPSEGLEILYKAMAEKYPDYKVFIAPDVDLTD